ncbi:hypothetical protein GA0061081_11064 [Gilliamella bombicola]|uniref:Uncharacterized protein n=1 Tax=Gilliamella bombicola TaxID=1798182 RepID=A0A1C4CS81_9GAMM|nr:MULTISPECIES: hypothetical protein [Gilliamella]NUF26831.1 hypothetical protein [Gilliamella sp. ESL0254]SCC21859.1 hypothetical protein GA0061081_11064 [Gilliamella bombicola]
MEISELLHDNWFNLIIIFVLSFIAFMYKKRPQNDGFDNIIKYTDILEKTPHPQYKTEFLNNIKKKLIWNKVCFYKAGGINKERIAISLINADVHNIIELTQLDSLTHYFSITKNHIIPLKPYLIKEVILSGTAFIFAFVILFSNIVTIFSSSLIINIIVAILTVFIIIIALFRFALTPIKRFKTYLLIVKDKAFLQRANNELAKIIKDKNNMNAAMIDEITEPEK